MFINKNQQTDTNRSMKSLYIYIGGSDEAFRSESRGKNVVRDGNMDKNDQFDR